MNKIVILLSVFCCIAVIAASCEKEPILEVSQSSFSFSDQGSSQTISFSTNKDWSASVSGGSWCTISPASGSSDVKSITVTVTANDTYDDRSATITIKAEELTKVITISQPKNKAILLTKDRYEVGTVGGSISVELRANIEYDVTIPTENQSWITNTTTKGLVSSNLTFAIAANATYDSRQGKIIIKEKTSTLSDTVYVSQTQKDAIILTSKTYNIADTAITISAELKSNVSYLVTIPSAAQLWITQTQTKALKTEQLQFNIARNTAFQPRSAEIIVRQSLLTLADTLYINQAKAPSIPILTTNEVNNIKAYSVSAGGNITSDGGADIIERGICWNTKESPTTSDAKKIIGKGSGTFSTEISNLLPVTSYYARAYAINRAGTAYGNELFFKTIVGLPLTTTTPATQITNNSVVTGGNVISDGGVSVYERGVIYGDYRDEGIIIKSGAGTGDFVITLSGLNSNTRYWIVSFATNNLGTSYGPKLELTTLAGAPTIVTSSITLSPQNNAEVIYVIYNDGGSNLLTRGVCWSTNKSPTIEDYKSISKISTGSFNVQSYTDQINNLLKNTTYYFRPFAINDNGISYGEEISKNTFGDPISDVDGNFYLTVKIGTQIWMAENLKTTKYRTGDNIGTTSPALKDISKESMPKYQWAYDGSEANANIYGRLYTWYAATDSRGICPNGWHFPSYEEWDTLRDFLGGESVAGGKLKEAGTSHWKYQYSDKSHNSSSFTALPGGHRINTGFEVINVHGVWWCSNEYDATKAWYRLIFSDRRAFNNGYYYNKESGYSIRCVKD